MFFRHLQVIKKSYAQHLYSALRYSLKLYVASQVLLIHAIIPCLFETTATDIIKSILEETEK